MTMIIHIPLPIKRHDRLFKRHRLYLRLEFYSGNKMAFGGRYKGTKNLFMYRKGYEFMFDIQWTVGKVLYSTFIDEA